MSAHDTFCLRVAIPRPTALPPIRSKLDVMAAPDNFTLFRQAEAVPETCHTDPSS